MDNLQLSKRSAYLGYKLKFLPSFIVNFHCNVVWETWLKALSWTVLVILPFYCSLLVFQVGGIDPEIWSPHGRTEINDKNESPSDLHHFVFFFFRHRNSYTQKLCIWFYTHINAKSRLWISGVKGIQVSIFNKNFSTFFLSMVSE